MASRYPSIGLGIMAILLVSTGAAFAEDTCYCLTSTGERVALGETACLKTNKGMREARCGLVLNNTSWKFTGKSCPLAWHGSKLRKNAQLATILGR